MWSTCPKQKAIRFFDGRSTEGLMAFQWNLLEDILDSVLHIDTSFKIVGSEIKLTVSKMCNKFREHWSLVSIVASQIKAGNQ